MIEIGHDTSVKFGIAERNERFVDASGKEYVPVVRCKDCEHYQAYTEFGVTKGYGFCVAQGMSPRVDDWFCADGERKEK